MINLLMRCASFMHYIKFFPTYFESGNCMAYSHQDLYISYLKMSFTGHSVFLKLLSIFVSLMVTNCTGECSILLTAETYKKLQKCNNRLPNRMTCLRKYCISTFTSTKSDHTLLIRYNNLLISLTW